MLHPGYWLDSKTGRVISVTEHGSQVLGNPKLFGMRPEDVDAIVGDGLYNPYETGKASARGKLILAACRNGWVRVRSNGQEWSLQLSGKARSGVMKFLRKFAGDLGEYSPIQVSDFATGFQQVFTPDTLRAAVANGTLVDAGGQAVGRDAAAEVGDKAAKGRADAIPSHLPDETQRATLRARIGQAAGIPSRGVEEQAKPKTLADRLVERVERKVVSNPTTKLLEWMDKVGAKRVAFKGHRPFAR
jgi:hypothetical protein